MTARHVLRALAPAALFLAVLELGGQAVFASPTLLRRVAGDGPVGRRLQSVQGARALGGDGRIAVGGGRLQADAGLGWAPRPGVHEDPRGVTTIDGGGHRVTAPDGMRARPGAPRVVLLGDSFTFGDEVADADAWAWRVAEGSGAAVTNLAALGYGLDQALLRWEAERPPADFVLLGLTSVMLLRTGLDWDAWAKPRFDLQGDALTLLGPPLAAPGVLLAGEPHLATPWLIALWRERLSGARPTWESLAPLNDALLDRWLAGLGTARPLVVYLPVPAEYERPQDSLPRRQVRDACAARHIPCLDATQAFADAHARGELLTRGVHWTPAGHALVADLVTGALPPAAP